MKFFPYVFKSLFRKKTRSLLTLASIVLPLFVICIMGTLLPTLEGDPTGGKGMFRLIVRHKVSLTNWVLESYMPKIAPAARRHRRRADELVRRGVHRPEAREHVRALLDVRTRGLS